MSKSTISKTTKKTKQPMHGWKPPEERAALLAEKLLEALETELARDGTAQEKYERILGSKGLLAHLPKLMLLVAQLTPPEEAAEEEISAEDLKMLREWLASEDATN